jgi:predicted nucleic acid-binding protein
MKVVFDTIIIDHLRNVKQATELVRKVKDKKIIGYVSTLTEAELFAGKILPIKRRDCFYLN